MASGDWLHSRLLAGKRKIKHKGHKVHKGKKIKSEIWWSSNSECSLRGVSRSQKKQKNLHNLRNLWIKKDKKNDNSNPSITTLVLEEKSLPRHYASDLTGDCHHGILVWTAYLQHRIHR